MEKFFGNLVNDAQFTKFFLTNSHKYRETTEDLSSGIARPGPTRACALPSTLLALPSAISFESRDSTMDQTKISCSDNNHKSVTNINVTA